jgi:hypothetical protein
VLQCLSAGAERWRDDIAAALKEVIGVHCVFERSDAEVRSLEGLPARIGTLNGVLPDVVTIVEDGIVYRVDVVQGQKTGFYLGPARQPPNRPRARGRQARAQCLLLHRWILAGRASPAARRPCFPSTVPATRWTSRATISRATQPSIPHARNGLRRTSSRSCAGCATRARRST